MRGKATDEGNRRRAQDLAYRAMDARSSRETIRLCRQALEIDPRCVDALVLTASAIDDIEDKASHLARTVQIAEEDLGGEEYLKENRGYFWGMLETRPYMRARQYLAETLRDAGRIEAAIREYEAMLDLNPNDNQGHRYMLVGLYLETGDLDGVRRLQKEYGSESSAAFAWSAVLERLMSGDTDRAEQALAQARETNAYVEEYLLGRRRMPKDLPDYYGFGDEREAIITADVIGPAWEKRPEAMRWLREREAPAQFSSAKVGRNDPCPCGSGKKFKMCCLGAESTLPADAPSRVELEMMLNEIRQELEGKEFSSEEELDSFMREISERTTARPADGFDGLSAGQMHQLVNFPFEAPEIVEFPSLLSEPPCAPIVTLFELLADTVGEDGLKQTAKGNLPREAVQSIASAYRGKEKYQEFIDFTRIRSEEDFHNLHITRIVAQMAGLIRKYKGRFTQTKKHRQLWEKGAMSAVYPELLRAFADKFNWAYSDSYPEVYLVQHSFAYTLYLLNRYGDEWREDRFYEDAFLQAFPRAADHIEPTVYSTPEDTLRRVYRLRCLERFAWFLGLIEISRDSEHRLRGGFRLRATPLLKDAVVFHV